MTAQDWLGLTLTTLSIVALVAGAVKWYISTQMKPMESKIDVLVEALEDVRKETKTNGGASMRDEIKSIKMHQEHEQAVRKETNEKVNHMYEILIEYIKDNTKR